MNKKCFYTKDICDELEINITTLTELKKKLNIVGTVDSEHDFDRIKWLKTCVDHVYGKCTLSVINLFLKDHDVNGDRLHKNNKIEWKVFSEEPPATKGFYLVTCEKCNIPQIRYWEGSWWNSSLMVLAWTVLPDIWKE